MTRSIPPSYPSFILLPSSIILLSSRQHRGTHLPSLVPSGKISELPSSSSLAPLYLAGITLIYPFNRFAIALRTNRTLLFDSLIQSSQLVSLAQALVFPFDGTLCSLCHRR